MRYLLILLLAFFTACGEEGDSQLVDCSEDTSTTTTETTTETNESVDIEKHSQGGEIVVPDDFNCGIVNQEN